MLVYKHKYLIDRHIYVVQRQKQVIIVKLYEDSVYDECVVVIYTLYCYHFKNGIQEVI